MIVAAFNPLACAETMYRMRSSKIQPWYPNDEAVERTWAEYTVAKPHCLDGEVVERTWAKYTVTKPHSCTSPRAYYKARL